jgi:anti-sigma regulatory factor (Ser/Thr protein kinase)
VVEFGCPTLSPVLSLELPPEPRSPSVARRLVLEAFAGWDFGTEEAQDAALIATELVTNAIIHARPTAITLTLAKRGESVELRVTDNGHGRVELRPVDPGAVTGRGLRFLDELAAHWTVEPAVAGPGKTVVARLTGSVEDDI